MLRRQRLAPLAGLLLAAVVLRAQTPGTVILDDTFANGNSQAQDLANNSVWLFNGRSTTIRTDQPGSVTFDMTAGGTSSDAFWAYFTDSGSPITLGVGDKLSVAVTFYTSGFTANGQDIRWGVLDSKGTRNTANLTGGMSDATFVGDTGYGLQFYASGNGNPFVLGRRAVLTSANVFNSFSDFAVISGTGATARQTLSDTTQYTLLYTIERLSSTDTRLTASVTGADVSGLSYSGIESTPTPATSFDYFAFRISGTNFAKQLTFTEFQVAYTPAAPVITSQPQPTSLTLQVGNSVTLAVGANGSSLNYQWLKDGNPVTGNDSATTPTLNLVNVQHSDAGIYTAQVSNAGGTVSSSPVTLAVSDSPVPPPPAITVQPADASVTLGTTATLSVTATGDNLVYQWFKGLQWFEQVLPGANAPTLTIQNAQISDSGYYYVVVSNSSGSITSLTARLTVVSPMSALGFSPAAGAQGICVDTPLAVQFDQPPQPGATGLIQVYNSSGAIVDTIDMAANPQNRMIGGNSFNFLPIITSGNTANIYLHHQLPYADTYYVTMDPGVLLDASGAPFAGFSDPSFWTFTTQTSGPTSGASALTVAADNSGDFCTVQSAIDFVPTQNTQPVTITVQPGTYTEIDYVPSSKPFLTVHGADRNGTVIQYPNNNNMNPSTVGRAMFGVDASDFTLENITLHNTTPHGGSQAEAFRGNNQRILLNRVSLYSFQDTLLLQGTGFVTDSFIEGDVDFMWGTGSVFIQNSELKAANSNGYYTQIRNPQSQAGYIFLNNRLTSEPGVTGSYLGRIDPTVYPYSQVVYINNAMGPHIIPVGWLLNNSTSAPNVQFGEYGSTDLDGNPLDVSQRASFSTQLSDDDAAKWSDPAQALRGWVPYTVNSTADSTSVGAMLSVNWSAAANRASGAYIGLYTVGDPDGNALSSQPLGNANTGQLTFTMPANPGQYEFRLFDPNGVRIAVSGAVSVQ
ncbi:MAG TPA: pectinesterase family protein [Bryobacteraceae bacterium]|nr:pectinesterase family protein [Bryobacteraceae bacterium]